MRILLIEPYMVASHRAWAEGYARHSAHEVTLVTLPGYFWKWRMHGAAVALAPALRHSLRAPDPPELILASDMLDLTTLLALTRPESGPIPTAFYFHENQLTYPPPPGTVRDLHYGWINYVSSLAADRVLFNSAFHLEEWYEALPKLLTHFPDQVPLGTLPGLREKSAVLHPGVEWPAPSSGAGTAPRHDEGPLILWNHRWEYDKNPREFFTLMERLAGMGLPFRLAVAGENFRMVPEEFLAARRTLGSRIVHFGYAEPAQYRNLLLWSDIVVSTAIHEFFGIAVVEAIAAGCVPLLPARLSYPELIPPGLHDQVLYHSFGEALHRLRDWITNGLPETTPLQRHVEQFHWSEIARRYDALFDTLRRPG